MRKFCHISTNTQLKAKGLAWPPSTSTIRSGGEQGVTWEFPAINFAPGHVLCKGYTFVQYNSHSQQKFQIYTHHNLEINSVHVHSKSSPLFSPPLKKKFDFWQSILFIAPVLILVFLAKYTCSLLIQQLGIGIIVVQSLSNF